MDLLDRPASELAALVATRGVSPLELVDASIERITDGNPALNAFCLIAEAPARAAAAEAEKAVIAGEELGSLHGVPIAVKDLTVTAGLRTTFGSKAYADFVPSEDAISVARLREAGAIIVGKTTTPEFGHKGVTESPLLGRTNNPWDLTRTAGGSSGGSAVAVATRMVPLAEGTDGAGSIRIPASCCGVVGLKPSFGRIPLRPRNPFETLVHQGPLAHAVADAALMLDVMAGSDPDEVYGAPEAPISFAAAVKCPDVHGWRVAYSPDLGIPGVDPEVEVATRMAVKALEDLGADIEEATPALPDPREPTMVLWKALCGFIARQRVLPHVGRQGMDRDLASLMDGVDAMNASTYYGAAFQFRQNFYRAMLSFFDRYRVLVTPTLSQPAMEHPRDGLNPAGLDGSEAERFLGWFRTYHVNLTGQPALSVPCGTSADGMPIGVQIIGAPRADADVLTAGAAVESVGLWRDRKPPDALGAVRPGNARQPLVI